MKHAFLCALGMASCLLAPPTHAQLQWLGPIPAAKPAASPAAAPPATKPPARSRQQIGNGDDDDILHSKHKGLPLKLVIKDNQARVCQLSRMLTTVCAVIEAPLPPGTTVKLWNLPDGTTALTYARTPGVQGIPDPDGKAARHFQAAFLGAARAVLTHTRSNVRTTVHKAEHSGDDGDGCGYDGCDGRDFGNDDTDSGDDANDGNGGDGGNDVDPSIPVVTVHGTPEPDPDIPQVIITGHYEPDPGPDVIPVLLAPLGADDPLAGLTDPCIGGPILRVCIIGKRPPLPVDEPPLPTGNPPIFPKWACNFAHFFCTKGQIPVDPDSLPPDLRNPSWPTQYKFTQCIKAADIHRKFCETLEGKASFGEINQCLDNVIAEYEDCYTLYGPPNPP